MRAVIGSPEYTTDIGVGDLVRDDLTRNLVKVIRVEADAGGVGVWIDDPYLDGARHPWELSPVGPWRIIG